ncbi:hypothetical protein PSN45_002490 [Yamadazyma tenuis]|uniref:Calponin-homology (CH) domain-containing protein n=1 Tax=Candida tenuis (strain ATCC 10573 / BCRC 21748 / CBS 615 / JCM 9827 / NBRC 10315 / NRRL Y-1498 / VKM Y-70) TaxID=590646 RepID=G3B0A4_CANTC|nr:uncharacterized protein CANTEDRAFT_92575 [Yamadazyma tenuis ATCC 10573]EGV65354.1 hypothetical protein CANTEDRAFT_92575 [Yamadazyma tenuis ATCC 10573]WEJ94985.1 hypothetical protein PSN45_002490 [Yamadazyma tenuis]
MSSILRFKVGQVPEWVNKQHKTMLRWINSKLNLQLTDLSKDLGDGLVLIQLTNVIIAEMDLEKTDLKLYFLKPLYTNPKLPIQKMENVNDFLEFIRIVLKINTTSISSESIIDGNLKLILGLTWSLFIFSTTSSIGLMNDGNSIIQIKQIVLKWVNSKYKYKEICNFDRDWSLEISAPDSVLWSILKSYVPSSKLIRLGDSKLQNMKSILQFANELGVPKLADVEDFKTLVPDEKCILFFILEWFKFFEMGNFDEQLQPEPNEENFADETYDEVLVRMADIIKNKFEYETDSLKFSNKITSIRKKLDDVPSYFDEELFEVLSEWDKEAKSIIDSKFLARFKDNEDFVELTDILHHKMGSLLDNLKEYEEVGQMIAKLTYKDMKKLENLYNETTTSLKSINDKFELGVTSRLTFDALDLKFSKVSSLQKQETDQIKEFLEKILNNEVICKLNGYLVKIEEYLTQSGDKLDSLVNEFEKYIQFIHKVDYYVRNLNFTVSPSNLKYIETFASTTDTDIEAKYVNFKNQLLKFDSKLITNELEFSLILEELTGESLNKAYIKSFIKLVPIKLLNLSFNDSDFSLVLESDDDDSEIDNSKLIFETQRRRVGSQLGNDKVYDLADFFNKFEDGLKF